MEILRNALIGYKLLFQFISSHVADLFYLVPFLIAICMILVPIARNLKIIRNRKRFKILKEYSDQPDKIEKVLMKNFYIRKIVEVVAMRLTMRLTMFNSSSLEANQKKAVNYICVLCGVFILAGLLISLSNNIWYMKVAYLILAGFVFYILITTATAIIRAKFTSRLPETYKLLNSRYMSQKNILKAIDVSVDDFHPSVRKVMFQVSSTLKKNDMNKIERTFDVIDRNYRNEYLTILLLLIKQAYYRGGNEAIQQQLEAVTEDIFLDIENHKDLAATSRAYMIGAAVISPVMLYIIEKFGDEALGGSSIEFYSSPQGANIKMGLLAVTAIYIIFMSYLEKAK